MNQTRLPSIPPSQPTRGDRPPQAENTPAPEVDLRELAKEIYALMKEDLRRERERQGRA